eukprot:9476203-Pyramimonas_sp.AAC.1
MGSKPELNPALNNSTGSSQFSARFSELGAASLAITRCPLRDVRASAAKYFPMFFRARRSLLHHCRSA